MAFVWPIAYVWPEWKQPKAFRRLSFPPLGMMQ